MKHIKKFTNISEFTDFCDRPIRPSVAYCNDSVQPCEVRVFPPEDPYDSYDPYDPYDAMILSLRGETEDYPFAEVYYSAQEKSPLFTEGEQVLGATVVSHDFDETESVGCVTFDANVSEEALREAFPDLKIAYIDGAE